MISDSSSGTTFKELRFPGWQLIILNIPKSNFYAIEAQGSSQRWWACAESVKSLVKNEQSIPKKVQALDEKLGKEKAHKLRLLG